MRGRVDSVVKISAEVIGALQLLREWGRTCTDIRASILQRVRAEHGCDEEAEQVEIASTLQ